MSIRALFYAFFSLLIVFGFYLGVVRSSFFQIQKIEVIAVQDKNTSPLLFKDLQGKLEARLQRFKNVPLWQVQVDKIQSVVMQERWVKKSRVSRVLPNSLRVWVEMRSIAAFVYDGKKKIAPVSFDGALLSSIVGEEKNLPFLSGENFYVNADLRSRALDILALLPESGGLSRATVSEFFYRAQEGFSVLIKDGYEVLLGADFSVEKVAQVNQVLNYLSEKNVSARVIDARLSKKVLVRPRKGP